MSEILKSHHLCCPHDMQLWLSPSAATYLYVSEFWGPELCFMLPQLPAAMSIRSHDWRFPIPAFWRNEWHTGILIVDFLVNEIKKEEEMEPRYRSKLEKQREEGKDNQVLCIMISSASFSEQTASHPGRGAARKEIQRLVWQMGFHLKKISSFLSRIL